MLKYIVKYVMDKNLYDIVKERFQQADEYHSRMFITGNSTDNLNIYVPWSLISYYIETYDDRARAILEYHRTPIEMSYSEYYSKPILYTNTNLNIIVYMKYSLISMMTFRSWELKYTEGRTFLCYCIEREYRMLPSITQLLVKRADFKNTIC